MKKRLIRMCAMTSVILLVASGCSNKNIDTAHVRQVFQSLSGEGKQYLEEGLTDIDQGNYAAAVKPLNKVAFLAKLDKDQRLLLKDTLAKVEAKAAQQK